MSRDSEVYTQNLEHDSSFSEGSEDRVWESDWDWFERTYPRAVYGAGASIATFAGCVLMLGTELILIDQLRLDPRFDLMFVGVAYLIAFELFLFFALSDSIKNTLKPSHEGLSYVHYKYSKIFVATNALISIIRCILHLRA